MKLTEREVLNLKMVSEKASAILYKNDVINVFEFNRLVSNPLRFLTEVGLISSIREKVVSNKIIFHEFQSTIRNFARRIREGINNFFNECFVCVFGLLMMFLIVFSGAQVDYPMLLDLKETLNYYLLQYFGPKFMAKSIITLLVDKLKDLGLPHISAYNLAKYLCYKRGLCPKPGIL